LPSPGSGRIIHAVWIEESATKGTEAIETATPKTKRRKRPVNGLSTELMDAMLREYTEWQSRVQAEDPNLPATLSADDLYFLESGRMPVDQVQSLRKRIFADLVSRGFSEADVCQRLVLSHKSYCKLALRSFGVDDPKLVRAQCSARNLERQGKIKDEINRMDEMRQQRIGGDRSFTTAERDSYFKLIKLANDLDESYRKLHAADAPEQVEVKEIKQYDITLNVRGTREELSDILEGQVIDVPALPPPEVSDGS
jgi:dsDNA-binding SOS-regulon protein